MKEPIVMHILMEIVWGFLKKPLV